MRALFKTKCFEHDLCIPHRGFGTFHFHALTEMWEYANTSGGHGFIGDTPGDPSSGGWGFTKGKLAK